MVKHLSAVLETWARSLGREDPLEKEYVCVCVYTYVFMCVYTHVYLCV